MGYDEGAISWSLSNTFKKKIIVHVTACFVQIHSDKSLPLYFICLGTIT